jgi:single-strand DNA-binding protein
MASFNKVILMGNLTRDPETRYAGNGTAIVKFGLAVNERFQGPDGQWQDRPTFVDVTLFGKRAEAFAKFHTKGKPAFIEGKLRLDTWEDKEGGGKRSKLYVVGDAWEFVGGGKEGGGGGREGGFGGGSAAPATAGSSGEGGGWDQPGPDADFSDTPF